MSIDESQVTAAVAHVDDPELRRPLGELGMVGEVRAKRHKVVVEVALPVAHYPQVDELAARVRAAVARARRRRRGDGGHHGDGRGDPGPPAHAAPRRRRRRRHHARRRRRPRARPRVGGRPRPRGGPAQQVHGAPFEDADPRDLVGQGRGGQVLGHGEPGRGPHPGRLRRGHPGRRRLRVLRAEDAGHHHRPADHRRPGGPADGQRGPLPVDGLLRGRRHAGHLAGPDAAQGARAVPGRRLLGRARLPADRHAPGHGRRDPLPRPVPDQDRGLRRHHAAAGRPAGGPAVGLRGPQAQVGRARGDREHELVHR